MVAPEAPSPTISVIDYTSGGVHERTIADVAELGVEAPPGTVRWIDVQGLGDEALLRRLGEIFDLHPLALEDVVNVPQRPKSELYDHQQLFIARMARVGEQDDIDVEQVSLFVGKGYVLTLQERRGDVFDPVRHRIRLGQGLIRRSGPDYLAYALLDTVIDGYYPVIEALGDRLHDLEEEILASPTRAGLRRIHRIRRDLLALRRSAWPQREAVHSLIREESPWVGDPVRQFLRDTHDHVVQIVDVIETYRELAASLMDIYLSSLGQRTNGVMKVLTIMASIFIPLTFLAGVYGMNFEFLPELKLHWAYPAVLAVMALTAGGMLLYFRRRGWIGRTGDDREGPS
jgi:magnesium transporter